MAQMTKKHFEVTSRRMEVEDARLGELTKAE